MLLQYWYMFFVCAGIATLAMSAGIGGATFYIPFVLLVLKVPVQSALPIGIFVEVFGFAAGVYNYARRDQVDYGLAKRTLFFAVPFVVLGVVLQHVVKPTIVEYLFSIALMIFATQLLVGQEFHGNDPKILFGPLNAVIATVGGVLLGFLGTGMGETNEYNFFSRLGKPPAIAAGTSVLVVAAAAMTATTTQTIFLLHTSQFGVIQPYIMLILYSILGAMAGAKSGAWLANHVDRLRFRKLISIALFLVAITSLLKTAYLSQGS